MMNKIFSVGLIAFLITILVTPTASFLVAHYASKGIEWAIKLQESKTLWTMVVIILVLEAIMILGGIIYNLNE